MSTFSTTNIYEHQNKINLSQEEHRQVCEEDMEVIPLPGKTVESRKKLTGRHFYIRFCSHCAPTDRAAPYLYTFITWHFYLRAILHPCLGRGDRRSPPIRIRKGICSEIVGCIDAFEKIRSLTQHISMRDWEREQLKQQRPRPDPYGNPCSHFRHKVTKFGTYFMD